MKKERKCITLSVRCEENCLYLTNGLGQEWKLPNGFSTRASLSMLVYGSLMNKTEEVSCYSSKFKISMEVEILDGE